MKLLKIPSTYGLALVGIVALCAATHASAAVKKAPYGTTANGEAVDVYTVTNKNGLSFKAITYGGIITELRVPDRDGKFADIVCGFDNLADYEAANPYFGALIGRYGNRIAKGTFALNGKTYSLAKNDEQNALHGGVNGFNRRMWRAKPVERAGASGVVFSRVSPDGEEGYPGNLACEVSYLLTDDNALVFEYKATTDAATPCNLTQHSYFNLSGDFSRGIRDTEARFLAKTFVPVDKTLIPTGELRAVKGTPFDFSAAKPIGRDIAAEDDQLVFAGGYDHTFVADKPAGEMGELCEFYEPQSGRILRIFSTEPGIQFYSGNFLDGTNIGKNKTIYGHRAAFVVETQHFPDSPNQPAFPSTILNPGETYQTRTVLQFATR